MNELTRSALEIITRQCAGNGAAMRIERFGRVVTYAQRRDAIARRLEWLQAESEEVEDDFAAYQASTIGAIFREQPYWKARTEVARLLHEYHQRIADLEAHIARQTVAPTEQLATLLDAAQRREEGALSAYYELEADILSAYPVPNAMAQTTPHPKTPSITERLNALATEIYQQSRTTATEVEYASVMVDAVAEIRELNGLLDAVTEVSLKNQERVKELEAQLEVIKNPPYTLIVNRDEFLGDVSWSWQVVRGELQIAYQGDYTHEYEARAVGQGFLDKLTAPFERKD